MNLLAHFHLSESRPEALLGSFLGDFVKGDPSDRYGPDICRAIHVHRRIDAFTDRHPGWRASKARLSPERRRLAGILVDIFYDHFLSVHWPTFQPGSSLPATIGSYYRELGRVAGLVDDPAAGRALARMIDDDWLGDYGTRAGIADVLERVSRRSPAIRALAGGIEELQANASTMEADFLGFYPDLVDFAGVQWAVR